MRASRVLALKEEFRRIKAQHRDALKKTTARVVLGPSVMRVFKKGTRNVLLPFLSELEVDEIIKYKDQAQYSDWFDKHVRTMARIIERKNPNNTRIRPGLEWGHTTKIMSLYVRDLVVSSRYFNDKDADRISFFLHAPIDSIAIKRLTGLGIRLPFTKIKEIDTREKFYSVQEFLANAAHEHRIPRVWFDDNWGDRQRII